MNITLTSIIIGGMAGGLAVLAIGFLMPRRSCPKCNTLLPRIRKPVDGREALLGGCHCPNCNAKITRNGSLRAD